jgi:putative peptidoglycan lipid II flippase
MGFPLGAIRLPRRDDERVLRVLKLMLPVSIGLGLINLNVFLNTAIGFTVDEEVPRAIEAAFRIYMLPQGMFSVAVATVLFPQLARLAARDDYAGLRATIGTGMRQIGLLLIPAGAAMAVLAEPLVRLVFERGEWDAESTALTADALFWFAFSLPFSGWVLMLTRGFFSLQQPTTPTKLAVGSLAINAVGSYLLSKPFGIAGIVLGTIASNVALVLAEAVLLRRALGGFETRETLAAVAKMLVGAGVLAAVSYGVWYGLDAWLGDALIAQIVSVFTAVVLGSVAYAGVILGLQIPEARQILDLFARRLRRRS